MVEWIVVCAALTVLDDEIIIAAERAGVPLASGPPGRQPSTVRPARSQPSMRGPPAQSRGAPPPMPPQPQRSLPPQGLVPGQHGLPPARGAPPGGEGYYQNGGRPDPRGDPRGDPRMMDPRYAQQQQQQQQALRGDPRLAHSPPSAGSTVHGYGPPPGPSAQPARHQLRDEPARGPPPPAAQPSTSQPRAFAPPSQRPGRAERDEPSAAELLALNALSLEEDEGPSELAYGAAEPGVPRTPTLAAGGGARGDEGAFEYAQMAAGAGAGYQAEPVGRTGGYQQQQQQQQQHAQQQQGYAQPGRQEDPRVRGAMPPGAGPASHNGHGDPRLMGRNGPPPVRGPSVDSYGGGGMPQGQRHPNGYNGLPPPQQLHPAHHAPPPREHVQQPPPPPQQPRGPPAPPAPPASPPPPDPSTPEFLTWVASREEHKWPEEEGGPRGAGAGQGQGQGQGGPPGAGGVAGRMPSSYRAGPPRQGYQGGGLGEGAYRGPQGGMGPGALGPGGMGRLDVSAGAGGGAGRGPGSPSGKGKLVKQRAR